MKPHHTHTKLHILRLPAAALALALAASLSIPLEAGPKIPAGDGPWGKNTWLDSKQNPADALSPGDDLFVANNKTVVIDAGELTLRSLSIGTNGSNYEWLAKSNASGVLSVTGGNLNITGPRFTMGTFEGANGVLNVEGGIVTHSNTTASGFLGVGMAPKTVGFVRINDGRLTVNSFRMGVGDGATATILVAGGELESTGIGTNTHCYVPRPVKGAKNAAYFEQTGGKVSIQNNTFFFIGTSSDPAHNTRGIVKITGGAFMGRICVGGKDGEGEGQLIVGPAAKISMYQPLASAGLVLRKTGRLVFQLGATPAFNPIDLKQSTKKAINIEQPGAMIIIDGSALPYDKNTPPITLIEYRKGAGPSDAEKANLEVKQTGFDENFTPSLAWADDKLVLYPQGLPK